MTFHKKIFAVIVISAMMAVAYVEANPINGVPRTVLGKPGNPFEQRRFKVAERTFIRIIDRQTNVVCYTNATKYDSDVRLSCSPMNQ